MKKMILLMTLLAVTVFLTATLAACSCGDETPAVTSTEVSTSLVEGSDSTPDTTAQKPAVTEGNTVVTTTKGQTVETSPVSTEASTTGTKPVVTTVKIELPVDPIAPWTETVDASGMLFLVEEAVKGGHLLIIDQDHAVEGMFDGNKDTTADAAIKAGYTHISNTFRTVDNNHFLRNEAMEALKALIGAFDAVAGTDRPFIVEGFTASADATSTFASGNVLKLRIFENDVIYGLNYNTFKVSLNDEMVTYDKWFETVAAMYGFIYEGLVGEENNAAGQLRYVGAIHAMGIKQAGSFEAYIDAIKNKTVTTATVGEDTWNLYYVKLSQGDSIVHYTVLNLGANATYTVSGDNCEGVIVAVKQAIAE